MTSMLKRRSTATRTWTVAVAGVAALALAAAGCGSSSGGQNAAGYGAPSPSKAASSDASASGSGNASVALASSKLGKILVDAKGRTLYLFEADKGSTSMCNGACASAWPPLTTAGKPLAGPGISASKLGTTKLSDGTTEVTYSGHPLYTFAGDSGPGQTAGQGSDAFGAEWYVLSAAGNKIEN